MARFVLVHGAFSGGWIWEPLAKRLAVAGHSVEAPDLPGSGEDKTPTSNVTLKTCAARVCEALQKSSQPSFLVGNRNGRSHCNPSSGPMSRPGDSARLWAAFAPQDGQSLLDLTRLPEGAGDQVQANITIEGEPPSAIMPAAASRQALYGSCADEVAAWAIGRQRPQPIGPFVTPVSIPPGVLHGINRYFVLCTRDRAIPLPLQRRMIAENVRDDVVELDTDHTPHLSMTDELAEALHRFATHASQPSGVRAAG